MAMAVVELRAFLALLESLGPDDWARPTACTLWDVHDVVAHVTGAAASYAERAEFARQWNPVAQRRVRLPGFSVLDALNQVQVADRAEAAPDLLIAELRKVGPRAIATRRRIPAPLRAIRLPMPALGVASVGYLTDLIYTRDTWIHRLDISRATGRPMALNPVHDGRVVALMARDLDRRLPDTHGARAMALELTGPAGGHFRLGADEPLRAYLAIDALDFAWLAAGRIRPDDALNVSRTQGDSMLIRLLLENAAVPV